MNFRKILAAAAVASSIVCSGSASAAIINFGNLSSDTATGITKDVNSGRSYARFNAFDLTYAETLAAVSPGGSWAGWSMADWKVSDQFVAAAVGVAGTACDGNVAYGTACGTISAWSDGKLGASYTQYLDYYTYLDSYGGAGLLQIDNSGRVADYERWSSLTAGDGFSGASAINYLLFKEAVAEVPEPGSLALFGIAMLGAIVQRKRAKKA